MELCEGNGLGRKVGGDTANGRRNAMVPVKGCSRNIPTSIRSHLVLFSQTANVDYIDGCMHTGTYTEGRIGVPFILLFTVSPTCKSRLVSRGFSSVSKVARGPRYKTLRNQWRRVERALRSQHFLFRSFITIFHRCAAGPSRYLSFT